MNNKFAQIVVGIALLWFVFVGGFFIHALRVAESLPPSAGSIGNEPYNFYTASSTSASANTPIVIKTRPGTLGSVVVATTGSGAVLRLYDSATATSAPALIASFPTSAVVGTYTFDVAFNTGLVIEAPTGFNGIYTVTYK